MPGDAAAFGDTAELLVSELVTNAVNASALVPADAAVSAIPADVGVLADAAVPVHVAPGRHLEPVPDSACQRVRLRLSYGRTRLRIEVWDGADRLPVAGAAGIADGEAESGRGLMLVEALSVAWGWYQTRRGGKVVWCEVGAVWRPAATLSRPGRGGGRPEEADVALACGEQIVPRRPVSPGAGRAEVTRAVTQIAEPGP